MDFFQILGYMLLGVQMSVYEGPAKSFFFHWDRITSVLRFIKHIFIIQTFKVSPLY